MNENILSSTCKNFRQSIPYNPIENASTPWSKRQPRGEDAPTFLAYFPSHSSSILYIKRNTPWITNNHLGIGLNGSLSNCVPKQVKRIIIGDIEKKNPNKVIFRIIIMKYYNELTVLGANQKGS